MEDSITTPAKSGCTLFLGRQGENLARHITFDLSAWLEAYGQGRAALAVRRSGDMLPYPAANVRTDGNTLIWTPTATDTDRAGFGTCELRWYVDDVLAKSELWTTLTADALGNTGEMPAAAQDYVARMQRIGNAVQEAVRHAPMIGENGNWLLWDTENEVYGDSGLQAHGLAGPQGPKGDSGGVTDPVKAALLTLAQKVAYVDEHGQDYYDALYAALYPPAELLSITASFAQGSHVVYSSDTLDSLKPYLTVTGAYDDGTSRLFR